MEPISNVKTTLILPKGYFKSHPISPKDVSKGITSKFLKEIWSSINCNLVEGEYKNLWALLHKDSNVNVNIERGLKYVFPALIEIAAKCGFSYLNVFSNANSGIPEIARKAGLTHRYMSNYQGIPSLCSVKILKQGKDNWPTFRASKESISAVVIIKSTKGSVFVILGKNQPNLAAIGSRPMGTITGYVNPDESPEEAVKRELREETGLEIPSDINSYLVGNTYKRDYYPGADDRNEVRVICLDMAERQEFELKKTGSKKTGDRLWTLIQHKTVKVDGQSEEKVSNEIKAADDLAKVYILPIDEALIKMKPGSTGRAKVQAAYDAVLNKGHLREQIVSFGWNSNLQKLMGSGYDNIVFTSGSKTV